jgi:hypothetical protein
MESMSFTEHFPTDLEIIITQLYHTVLARETIRMELLPLVGFEVLSFDATIAGFTK